MTASIWALWYSAPIAVRASGTATAVARTSAAAAAAIVCQATSLVRRRRIARSAAATKACSDEIKITLSVPGFSLIAGSLLTAGTLGINCFTATTVSFAFHARCIRNVYVWNDVSKFGT